MSGLLDVPEMRDDGKRAPGISRPHPIRPTLPHRAELDRIFASADNGTMGPREVLRALTGQRQLWWKCCREAVQADPGWLFHERTEAVVEQIAAWSAPANGKHDAVAEAATVTLAVSQSIGMSSRPGPANPGWIAGPAGDAPTSGDHQVSLLKDSIRRWSRVHPFPSAPTGGALLTDTRLQSVNEALRDQVDTVVRRLQEISTGPTTALVALTALLLATNGDDLRDPVRLPVVFARRGGPSRGLTGTLELQELPGGPAGLFPDPRYMGVFGADSSFWDALSTAWRLAPDTRNARCTLWRIVLDDGSPFPDVDGGSLGAAFAIALRELYRIPRRRLSAGWFRQFFRGIRPGIAVTGGVSPAGELVQVGHMAGKLEAAAAKRLRLIAPAANRNDALRVRRPDTIDFAGSVGEADRYARRWRTGRLAATAVLLVVPAATGTGVYMYGDQAADDRRLAARLAVISATLRDTNVDLAQLFAAEAYRLEGSSQTRSALFKSLTASPQLVQFLPADGPVTVVASSADGSTAVAGTRDGRLVRWDLPSGQRATIMRFEHPVEALAADEHGRAVVAADSSSVQRWTADGGAQRLELPTGLRPATADVSPSGRFAVVAAEDESNDIHLVSFEASPRPSAQTGLPDIIAPTHLTVPNDGEAVVLDGGYGRWQRSSLPTLKRIDGSVLGFGVHNAGAALSGNGEHFTYSNRGPQLPIWTARGEPSLHRPEGIVATRGQDPSALALSRDGSRLALADGSTIHVASVVARGEDPPQPESLTGTGPITDVAFLGDSGERLLSASADTITLWDLHQQSRISRQMATDIPTSCNGCGGPQIAVRPDGQYAAIVDGDGIALGLLNLQSPHNTEGFVEGDSLRPFFYGPPLWSPDGRTITLISPLDGSAEIRNATSGLPLTARWPAPPSELPLPDPPARVATTADGKHVIEIDASATIKIRDPVTGQIERRMPGPRSMAPTAGGPTSIDPSFVALDASASRAAIVNEADGQVLLTEITSGTTRSLPLTGVSGLAFLGQDLLIQRVDQALETWSFADAKRTRTVAGITNDVVDLVTNDEDLIIETDAAPSATLIDHASGDVLGTFALPVSAKVVSTSITFAPDRKTLIVATEAGGSDSENSESGRVAAWTLNDAAWLQAACVSAGHNLTTHQWKQYVGSSAPSNLECLR